MKAEKPKPKKKLTVTIKPVPLSAAKKAETYRNWVASFIRK